MEIHLFKWAMVSLISMIWAKFMFVITLDVFFFAEKHNWVKKS